MRESGGEGGGRGGGKRTQEQERTWYDDAYVVLRVSRTCVVL